MDALSTLKELSKLGKKEKEYSIGDVKITLGTLDTEQEGNVFTSCADLAGNAYFYKLKLETIKHSLRVVGNERLDIYLDVKEIDKREEMKKEVLDKIANILKTWDENVVSYLYSKWSELSKESEEELKAKGIIIE